MQLVNPEPSSPGSRLADWLELLALAADGGAVGQGELLSAARIEADGRAERIARDDVTGEPLDGEILDEGAKALVQAAFTEVKSRSKYLGAAYPYEVGTSGLLLSRTQTLRVREGAVADAAGLYVFCLLVSSLRRGLIELEQRDQELRDDAGLLQFSDYQYGRLFQICASVAVGGYINGEVVSFGYPRPDRTSFLPAHQATWKRFNAYTPVTAVPFGLPDDENDAGIDLVAWTDFVDGSAAKLLLLGQVASGENWSGKSVTDSADSLLSWFSQPAFKHYVPLMVMPFDITDARRTINRSGAGDLRKAVLEFEERRFGLIFDRCRVVAAAEQALRFSEDKLQRIDGHDRIDEVVLWVERTLRALRGVYEAA
jgi:hypothetical protein